MARKAKEKSAAPATSDLVAEAAGLLAAGDAEAAIEILQRASAVDPQSLRLQLVTGIVAWRLSNLEQALAVLHACHEQDPMNGTIAEVLAALVAQAGDLVESLYFGKIATALGPKAGYAELVPSFFPTFGEAFLSIQERPLFARAKLMASSGQLSVAIDFAGQHVSLNPGDDEARQFLVDGLLRIGAAAAAVQVLRPVARADAPNITRLPAPWRLPMPRSRPPPWRMRYGSRPVRTPAPRAPPIGRAVSARRASRRR